MWRGVSLEYDCSVENPSQLWNGRAGKSRLFESNQNSDTDSFFSSGPKFYVNYEINCTRKFFNLLVTSEEARFQEQLAELSEQLSARDVESNRLRFQMEDLQRDVLIKGSGMERLQAELAAAHKESECVRRRLRQLEDDLTNFKQQNRELQDELERRAQVEAEKEEESSEEESSEQDSSMQELETKVQELEEKVHEQEVKAQELEQQLQAVQVERDSLEQQRLRIEDKVQDQEDKVKELERQLQVIKLERDDLEKQRTRMEAERDEEMKIIQFALEEALEEKALVKCQFEKDFEKLRTVNTDREQQLLDDFEWKLREVEQACKRRLEEKDKQRKDMEIKLKLAQQQLTELPQLKTFEAEVKQLRGLTQEQQRSLRVSSRQTEQLQTSERLLKEDVARLKTQLDKEKGNYICMVSLNEKKITDIEKKFQARIDQQKTELTSQWEDRLRRECSRLKTELDQLHREEKHLAVESVKVQKDQELCTAKQGWERRVDDFLKEIAALKEQLENKETYYHQEMEKAQTNADRDIFDLRRKLDKIDLTYQEQMEKLNEKHEKEIEQLNWESERKVQQLEQNWQLQMSSTRTTLELVKEQMERDAQDRLDEAERQHQKQLDIQWERLTNDKEKTIAELEEKLRKQGHGHREGELLETIANLKKQLQGQTGVINDLQNNVDLLQGGMQVLNQEITTHNQDIQRVQKQADIKLRELETEHQKKISELKEHSAAESKRWQEQTKTMHDQFQSKINYLIKLLRDTDQKYRNRESRKEDVQLITELKQSLAEQESKVASLTKENRLYQLQQVRHHHAPRKKQSRSSSCPRIYKSSSVETNELVECQSETHRHCSKKSKVTDLNPSITTAV
ncbi:hypothetical protein C0J52_04581 [Blattella germanica]|nr:hypothetical protein C0J52_04581 [Blattella germanica]